MDARSYGRTGVICSVLLGLVAQGGMAEEATEKPTEVPRYGFEVGQEITYRSTSEFHYKVGGSGGSDRSLISKTDWTIAVVKRNPDGSWRLILRKAQVLDDRPARASLAYCDLLPDGRIRTNPTLGLQFNPTELSDLLVRLPSDKESLDRGWHASNETTGLVHHYRQEPTTDGSDAFVIAVEREGAMNEIYESTSRSVVQFDRAKGMVVEVKSERTQGWGIKGKGTGLVELKSVKTHPADWSEELLTESERYFQAAESYDKLLDKAERNPNNADEILSQALSVLNTARDELNSPLFLDQLDEQIDRHNSRADLARRWAQMHAEVVGRLSPDWEASDFDGNTHSLEQYRGSVVILDFWNRGCGWCIHAMPQVKELAEQFADAPVVVLGMNTDRVEDDARFVIETMGLNYPNLKASGLPEKYQVRAFPTLLIIDQEGRVHDIHIGYSPTLREDVTAIVEDLLAKR